jgi:hypothetical protein
VIERLAVAASIAVRHAGAYTDLILSDMDVAGRFVRKRVVAGSAAAGAIGFAIALACVWAIALAWDTAARMWTIAGLAVLFFGIAVLALRALRQLNDDAPPVLARTAHEWAKDRQLIEDVLARERELHHEH